MDSLKIALVHDHLAQDGGAEKVLKVFQELFPKAPTFVLVYNKKNANPFFENQDIRTSFLQKMPFGVRKYQWYLPVMPHAVESYDLSSFDLVLSSSSMFAKGVITRPGTLHVCYCHTPTRFLWSDTHHYIRELNYPGWFKKFIPFVLNRIRLWDHGSVDRVDHYIANSKTIQKRIKKYYGCPSHVIYPPVETGLFQVASKIEDYFLAGSRLVSYKRFDLIVQAFNKIGIKLKIFGTGPEFGVLRKQARSNIEFLGKVSDQEKAELYSKALAYLHPQEEDFGISAVEAMASGRPVIAYAKGGALETISPGVTGELFYDQCWEEIADYAVRFRPEKYDPFKIRAHALQYSVEEFKRQLLFYIRSRWDKFNR